MPSLRPALLLLALLASTAFAADPWDAPPFTADPKALIEAAGKVSAGDHDVILLLDERRHSVEADGRTRTSSYLVYRVVTAKGIKRVESTSASWAPWYAERPEIRARVIGPDGSVQTLDPKAVTEASAGYQRSIFSDQRILHAPLPGVAAGSVVEIVHEGVSKSVIPGAGTSGLFGFAGGVPEEHARLILEGPAGSFAPHIVNKAGVEPRTVEKDGRKQIIFERGHADAIDFDEAFLPSDVLLYPYVAFSTGTSWSELARGYAEIVDKQIAAADVRDIAAAASHGASRREEIVDRLLAYVEANVHYAGVEVGDGSIVPRVPTGVLKNKYGDCKDKATLLVALLRAAGLPAHVALLEAGHGFDVLNELPALNRFNHAIVVVGGETPIWVDPTDEFARAGALPAEDQGRLALIAAAETTSLARTPELPSAANRYIETRTFTLPEEGRAHVVEETTGTAVEEALMRRYRAESQADKYKESVEKYAKAYYVARAFDKVTTTDPRDLTKPFTLTLEVSESKSGVVANGAADVAIGLNNLILGVPKSLRDYEEADPHDAPASAKKRQHDFVFPRAFVKEWTYRIVLPPGYKPRTLPPNETTQLGTTTLSREYSIDGDGVVLAKFRFDSGKRRLTPAEFETTRVALSKLPKEKPIDLGFDSIGWAKLQAGDVRGSLDEFRRLAALHPKEAQHHREMTIALLTGGLGEAARQEGRKAIEIEPKSAAAHYTYALALEHDLLGRLAHTGFDLAGAIAELRKAKELDGTDLNRRIQLAEMLVFGSDGTRFSRGNHLAEAIDEYKGILKEFGTEAKGYEPRLGLFYEYAGRWEEMKTLAETMPDGEQKSLGRILAAVATSGVDAATRELDRYDAETRRKYAGSVVQTLIALGRYSDAAAVGEIAAQGTADDAQLQVMIKALKKARRGGQTPDTPAGAVLTLFRAIFEQDEATVKKLVPPETKVDLRKTFNPRSMAMDDFTSDVVTDLVMAMAEVQAEGNDDFGYRVRLRISGDDKGKPMHFFIQGEPKKYFVAAMDGDSVGSPALKLAEAGKLDAARTWLNWAREEISAGGGDDALGGSAFAALWPKDKAAATADEIRLAAAALASGDEDAEVKKRSLAVLLAAREKAADEQKKWIDVALLAAYGDPTKSSDVAERLYKGYPDSPRAFTARTLSLLQGGKPAEAEALAKQRLERSPRDDDALRMLSAITAKRNDYAAAAAYARRIVDELTPTEADYNAAAWIALFDGKNIDKAIEDAQHAASRLTGPESAAALHTLAALYAESGKNLQAKQTLAEAIDKRGNDTPASADWYVVGRMAENYGVTEAAVAAYKRVEKETVDGLSTWELTQRRLAAMNVK